MNFLKMCYGPYQNFLDEAVQMRGYNICFQENMVNSHYLEVNVNLKLLIFQSKFCGPRKFILRYQ